MEERIGLYYYFAGIFVYLLLLILGRNGVYKPEPFKWRFYMYV